MTLLTLCLAVLIAQIDTSVVNLALHSIGQYFHTDVSLLQWTVDGYNLTYAALLLTGGLLADLYGRRRLFMTGAAVFILASLICAGATSMSILLFGRVAAGLGAALLLPASLAIIRVCWPDPHARGRALGIWAACNGLALAIGPSLGGEMIHSFGWRSIFLLVVPIGLITLVLAVFSIPESSHPGGRHFDAGGQLSGAIALAALATAGIEFQNAPSLAAFSLAITAIAIAFFIRQESRRGEQALVPLALFTSPVFNGAMIATAAMTFGMYGVLFLLPLSWQKEGLLGPAGAGIALIPMALIFVLVSPFSGWLTERLGNRPVTSSGVGLIGCGLLLLAVTAHDESMIAAEVALILTGIGMGLATGPLMGVAVGAVSAARSGSAAALVNVARMSGATLGVAVLGSLFAIMGSNANGLSTAMAFGGGIQIAAAILAWRTTRPLPQQTG
ncbi:MFS transporter [Acidihalobacter yilgarnensis]|uniref:MFS transporter n=1 Tax=Acidihalobacter yilgarnensis TaxID=2819280 RepID=A0A1D8IMK9_9GAMM|nr:MFS transporter [Acidihalobacter yilgarnensis]AOU97700.1 MFS transporter [Acidihalobacter yilgarnensis]